MTTEWLGDGGTADATPRSRERWYVTAGHGRLVITRNGAEHVLATRAHLKQLGTRRTACGLVAHGWVTFGELGPHDVPADSYPMCADAIEGERWRR